MKVTIKHHALGLILVCLLAGSMIDRAFTSGVAWAATTWPSSTIIMTSTNTLQADVDSGSIANAYLDTRCLYVPLPGLLPATKVSDWWRLPANSTVVDLFCQTTGGTSIVLDLQLDDADLDSTPLTCVSGGDSELSPDGTLVGTTGEYFSANFGTEVGTVDEVVGCITFSRP